eukprot:12416554-Karenia_brevis.AAC.1
MQCTCALDTMRAALAAPGAARPHCAQQQRWQSNSSTCQGAAVEKVASTHGPAPNKTKDIIRTIWFEARGTTQP